MISIQDFFSEKIKLPSPPAIALKILKAVRQDDITYSQLAEILMADPALVARIMKLANSSLYGLSNRVNSLATATALIGVQTLKNIALSFVIVQDYQNSPDGVFDLDLFWRRAVSAAVSAEILALHVGYKDHDIFISALLQDLGILLLFFSDTDSFTHLLDKKRISGKSISELEKEHFGFDHAEISSHLLKTWGLPKSIYRSILYHHSEQPEEPYKNSAQILNIADKISAMYHGTQSNKKMTEIRHFLKETYHFQDEQIKNIIDKTGVKAREVMELFSIEPGDMKPFSQILQEAVEELGRLNFSYEQIVLELKQAKQNAEELAISLKRSNDRLRELAFRDELTGLFNHRYLQNYLESELQRSIRYKRPLSLLLLDIDFFKGINDTFGHVVGDHVLKHISKRMIKLVRHNDLVARYGGEEFAIVLPETGKVSGMVLAQRVRRGIEQSKMEINKQTINVTVSIGLVSTDMADIESKKEALFVQSDLALYKAKRNGRNRVEV